MTMRHCNTSRWIATLSLFIIATSSTLAFSPSSSIGRHQHQQQQSLSTSTTTTLYELGSIIEPGADDFGANWGGGGVTLAQESAIKILGKATHKPGSADAEVTNLLRYTKVVEVDDDVAKGTMSDSSLKLICTGSGKENYVDPGESTVKETYYSPTEAIKDALFTLDGSVDDAVELYVNFLGGDDLIFSEVMDGLKQLLNDLSLPTKCKVSWNSLCYKSFPLEECSVTVISRTTKGGDNSESGVKKSIASGEIYYKSGKWWTVSEEDINDAIE